MWEALGNSPVFLTWFYEQKNLKRNEMKDALKNTYLMKKVS